MVSEGAQFDIRKAVFNGERDAVAFRRFHGRSFSTSGEGGLFIDGPSIMFHLAG